MAEVTETGSAESVSQIQAAAKEAENLLSASYHQLTEHAFGKVILADLKRRFPTDQNCFSSSENFDTHAAAFRDGARTPVLHILKHIEAYDRRQKSGDAR